MTGIRETKAAAEPGVGWVIATDWTGLRGRNVEIYDHGELLDKGKVESVTLSGNILWLSFHGNIPRRIIEKLPEISVRVMPD
ncbi:hypothetical protein ACIPY2_08655 [Paenarthrobacter sp. NPDC089675]|uniref:hypothetical protein n=1 Tax=Paenarthrobacter sp. NPDC089675 TaxID=3364376 RepID=UPI0037F4AEEE